ncbi:ABC transporter ATP-binding protein [Vibrio sp. 10N.261.46.A3]|uniref:ABC transporter ATP-binding protein n=1 Tax=Vibrio sp. 10N.261.46.A3 TaxID=3229658 RepID=UPI00354C8D19
MSSEKFIRINDLTVSYPLIDAHSTSIKSIITNINRPKHNSEHLALNDINITINEGERICLIGRNGAGKSTLLKTIAGIYSPVVGKVDIQGKLSTLLDFATGFEMEMTGYDNIIIRGLLLGMTYEEVLSKREDIAQFADLGDFINQPLKTYSSGMFVRLAFAVATSIEPDILVIDEIVGAGDASFTEKANRRMEVMLEKGKIIVMATHSDELARKFCNRGIWIDNGRIALDGPVEDVLNAYHLSH